MISQKLLKHSELIEEETEMDNPMVGYVTVSSRMPTVPERVKKVNTVGVQAGDDLIKVAMDRIKLMEKNKRMFYGSPGRSQNGSADRFTHLDGSFSPAPKHSNSRVVMRAELVKDFGTNERVMKPSIKQQKASKDF